MSTYTMRMRTPSTTRTASYKNRLLLGIVLLTIPLCGILYGNMDTIFSFGATAKAISHESVMILSDNDFAFDASKRRLQCDNFSTNNFTSSSIFSTAITAKDVSVEKGNIARLSTSDLHVERKLSVGFTSVEFKSISISFQTGIILNQVIVAESLQREQSYFGYMVMRAGTEDTDEVIIRSNLLSSGEHMDEIHRTIVDDFSVAFSSESHLTFVFGVGPAWSRLVVDCVPCIEFLRDLGFAQSRALRSQLGVDVARRLLLTMMGDIYVLVSINGGNNSKEFSLQHSNSDFPFEATIMLSRNSFNNRLSFVY